MAGEPREPELSPIADRPGAELGLDTDLHPVLAELVEWETEQRVRDARRAGLIAQAHRAGLCDEHGQTAPMWIADAARLPTGAARELVRRSVRLTERFPELAAALAERRIGWHHVSAFDRAANPRIVDDLAALIPELIDLAEVATYERWVRELRGLAEQLDQDGGYDPAGDPATNELHLTPTFDGITHVSGRLAGELALLVRSLVNAEAERVMDRHRADLNATGDTERGLPSMAQARAEALAELLDRGAATDDSTARQVDPEIVVVYDTATDSLHDDEGNQLSPAVLRWILAAGLIRPLETTEHRDVLRMGHLIRYANRHQRRALTVRDGGCIFPGCTRTATRCDAHHVEHWNPHHPHDGGTTDIENLALLCRHHHRVTHQPGWHMERWYDPDHPDAVVFRWRTPAGRVIYSQRHGIPQQPAAA